MAPVDIRHRFFIQHFLCYSALPSLHAATGPCALPYSRENNRLYQLPFVIYALPLPSLLRLIFRSYFARMTYSAKLFFGRTR